MGKNLSKLVITVVVGLALNVDIFSAPRAIAKAPAGIATTAQLEPEAPESLASENQTSEIQTSETQISETQTSEIPVQEALALDAPESLTSETLVSEVPAGPSITVNGKTLPISESSSMADESGDQVLRYEKLLRGHNSEEVFRVLYGMNACGASENCTFSVNENGVVYNYQIAERVEYTVEDYNGGRLSSDDGDISMYSLATKAKGHDYALFTCFGEYDATIGRYRQVLVLYADAI